MVERKFQDKQKVRRAARQGKPDDQKGTTAEGRGSALKNPFGAYRSLRGGTAA